MYCLKNKKKIKNKLVFQKSVSKCNFCFVIGEVSHMLPSLICYLTEFHYEFYHKINDHP